jgi:hypothetical protein
MKKNTTRFSGLRNNSLMLFPTFNGIGKDFRENMEGGRLIECSVIGQAVRVISRERICTLIDCKTQRNVKGKI